MATKTSPRSGFLTRYLSIESASGLVLIVATGAAFVLANSRWAGGYEALLRWRIAIEIRGHTLAIPFHAFVNDGLMTLFFFVVGLEIRREMHAGELADAPRAALPAAAALGGMVVPAILYTAVSPAGPAERGWGIPMATDIAFAVAALALLGKRVAPALRVLLLAIAILDDIGGVLVIAVFYSDGIVTSWLPIVAIGVLFMLAMQRNGIRSAWPYAFPAMAVWIGVHGVGIHATMAGVLLGLLTPPQRDFARRKGDVEPVAHPSPSERMQTRLHPWVAFGIMPIFAFANAGVMLGWPIAEPRITAGILVGLALGKPIGIVAATWLMVRLGIARLPAGVDWRGVTVVGLVAGVGFTVALFIANLALVEEAALDSAKLGIVMASLFASLAALIVGFLVLPRTPSAAAAATAEAAEASADQ